MDFVHQSTNLSIIIQALSGIYTARVLGNTEPKLLVQSVKLEGLVTLIQFIFYTVFIRNHAIDTMSITRYYDWMLTTPLMLTSMSAYFLYKRGEEGTLYDVIVKYKKQFIKIVSFNLLMLVAGYLGEIGCIPKELALVIGTIAFVMTFSVIYKEMGGAGKGIFNLVTTVWGLYGVAYMLPSVQKNLLYNGLDLVSKNLFAVLLTNEVLAKIVV
jgi:bacteriorhodopsin